MTRRVVQCSTEALERARAHFPIGGSPSGRPSWDQFERILLKAAKEAFGRDFEGMATEEPGHPVRYLVTAATPLFREAVIFFALLVSDDVVEIVDIEVDRGHQRTLSTDPDD